MQLPPQFRADAADRVWSAGARLARFAAFESALAAAEAEAGAIPEAAAMAIARVCAAPLADPDAVFRDAGVAGNPAIPFVARLGEAVAAADPEAARFVHHGATSQDLIDSADQLALAELARAIEAALVAASAGLAALATRHASTPVAARTLLQQAAPITFGLKAATWRAGLESARRRLAGVRAGDLAVQLGGATGSGAVLGAKLPAVRSGLARRLGLADPGFCWHVVRDRVLAAGAALAGVTGAAAKLAGDVVLLMQPEIGEVFERAGPGRGGSSAMPHKRNPVDALVPVAALPAAAGHLAALAAAQAHEHERAAGAWHAEWLALPALSTLALAAAERARDLVAGLEIDAERMARNLELQRGLLASEALAAALAQRIGRADAHASVERLSRRAVAERASLAELAAADAGVAAALEPAVLAEVFGHGAAIVAATDETRRLLAAFPAGE